MDTHDIGEAVPENSPLIPDKPLSVGFDYSRYEHLLDDENISPEDKRRVLEALWDIVSSFVMLGFGVHPAQVALEARASREHKAEGACGKLEPGQSGESQALVLYSEDKQTGGTP